MFNVYIFWFQCRTCKSIYGLTLPIYLNTVVSFFWAITSIINVGAFVGSYVLWRSWTTRVWNASVADYACHLFLQNTWHEVDDFVCVFGGFSAQSTLTTSSILLEQLYGNGKKGNCWGCTEHVLKLVHFYCYLVERKGEGSMVQAVKFWGCFVFVGFVCCVWEYRLKIRRESTDVTSDMSGEFKY